VTKNCAICGGSDFEFSQIIWPELAAQWRLAPDELAYIDRQQGGRCTACGMNLRSIALGAAIRRWLPTTLPLQEAFSQLDRPLNILEINEAGMLTPLLQKSGNWTLASYPEVDIHALPYATETFDLVVHSDTLEHVAEPVRGLAECRRVLKPGGACCYTIPMIVGRLSGSRAGLAPSFHGVASESQTDFLVHTEFGADAWTYPMRAGFDRVAMTAFEYPSAIAFTCPTLDS
jgi:SAM-dependent methyltransferase